MREAVYRKKKHKVDLRSGSGACFVHMRAAAPIQRMNGPGIGSAPTSHSLQIRLKPSTPAHRTLATSQNEDG
ncbi:hypothetical protein NCPPB940_14670 [Xanthomonas hortorum pv. taraxaci]|nr:hypothetical protein NCPPB940_14670 [Xanthomonas hortorum pv. taraxaci]CAD0318272.1 hypothetical protein NCPPB940_14670 [Xanthomonas hortorum pv. taraxaci]